MMDNKSPLVSIIMPAFNASQNILKSIDSVKSQSYNNWELIIIDDRSTDNTCEIVEQVLDGRITLLKLTQNDGVGNARNRGLKIAKGDYLTFLDSDDLWHSEKLKRQVQFHIGNKKIKISHTDFYFFDQCGVRKRRLNRFINSVNRKQGYLYPDICYQNPIGILTVMLEAGLMKSINDFDTHLNGTEDYDLWIRIAKGGHEFGYIRDVLSYYRVSTGGLSKSLGRYKKANRILYNKVLRDDKCISENKVWRAYYRYFGVLYLAKNNFKMSFLYFRKSVGIIRFDYLSMTTYVYMFYVLIKCMLNQKIR